jgi:hypothetical protein
MARASASSFPPFSLISCCQSNIIAYEILSAVIIYDKYLYLIFFFLSIVNNSACVCVLSVIYFVYNWFQALKLGGLYRFMANIKYSYFIMNRPLQIQVGAFPTRDVLHQTLNVVSCGHRLDKSHRAFPLIDTVHWHLGVVRNGQ